MTELWFLGLKSHVWLCPNLLDRILEVKCEWLADSIFFFFLMETSKICDEGCHYFAEFQCLLCSSNSDEPSQNFFLFLPYHIYTLVQFKWDPIKSSAKCSALDCFAGTQVQISLNLSKSDKIMRLKKHDGCSCDQAPGGLGHIWWTTQDQKINSLTAKWYQACTP